MSLLRQTLCRDGTLAQWTANWTDLFVPCDEALPTESID
jgi:hypothetical protein